MPSTKRRRLFNKSRLILLCAKDAIYMISFNSHNTFTRYSHFINWGTENFPKVTGLVREFPQGHGSSKKLQSGFKATHPSPTTAQSRQSVKVCLGSVGKCWLPCEEQMQWLLGEFRGQRGDRGTLPHRPSLEVSSSLPVLWWKNTWEIIKQKAVSGKIHQNLINWTKGDKMARNRPQGTETVDSGWDFSFHPLCLLRRPIHHFSLRLLIRETPATLTQHVNYENRALRTT